MYLVIELQKENNDVASIVTKKGIYNKAMLIFYSIFASTAISQVDAHSAAVLNDVCQFIKSESFDHIQSIEE